jgi:hypothetical protein
MKVRFLGPSKAHRWSVCPGSVQAEAMAPTGEDSAIANEGTAAHLLLDTCLRKETDAEVFLDEEMVLPKNAGTWRPDEDMVQHVQEGVDLVRLRVGKGKLWTENYVPLMIQGVQCGGTLDCGWYGQYPKDPLEPKKGMEWQLHVLDLKYGYAAVADPKNNKQIRIYALGKYKELARQSKKVDKIHLWIYQPRLGYVDGPFIHNEITVKDLALFEKDLKRWVDKAKDPKAKRVAGSHCLYCGDHGGCRTAEQAMYKKLRNSFTEEETERVGAIMYDIPLMRQWIASVQNLAYSMAQHGAPPDGWVLGTGRRSKVWNGDREKLVKQLSVKFKSMGLKEDDYAPRKMLGVAKVGSKIPTDKKPKFDALWHFNPGRERLVPTDNAKNVPRLETYFDSEDSDEFLE